MSKRSSITSSSATRSLFTGDAGQGESNIRRWIVENDWLEAIVALPLNLFYNTGIATYVWVLTNRKPEHRKGRVQLIDATQWYKPLRKNLGKKNCELSDEDIQRICETFLAFEETAVEDLPQRRVRVLEGHGRTPVAPEWDRPGPGLHPQGDQGAEGDRRAGGGCAAGHQEDPQEGRGCGPSPRPVRRHHRWQARRGRVRARPRPARHRAGAAAGGRRHRRLRREVLPHAPDAWYVPDSVKIGYEISFTRYFYMPKPLRTLEEIRADILALEKETEGLLEEIIGADGD